jgi:pimeloyl-ACP methyl ester carboxylesterase
LITRRPRRVAYSLEDMAGDGIALLDHLGIERAHVIGASMGGMIAQVMAARHPDRVLSLVSIMSTTGGRFVGQPTLRALPTLLARPPRDRQRYVEHMLAVFRKIGSPGFPADEDDLRDTIERSFDRGLSASGTGRQLAAIIAAGDRSADLRRITVPTLVIHGTDDPLVGVSGGRATARAIRGAQLMLIRGMGHSLPRGAWPQILDGIVENAARAGEVADSRSSHAA